MKIRDNETGEVFEYGTNIHHALRISKNGGCLTFENLQNGDGSLKSGDGGYSFVLNDGKTPEESSSPDSMYGATYANIGGFHEHLSRENAPEITRSSRDNDVWIPVEERMPEEYGEYLVTIVPSAGYLWAKRIIANFSDLMGIVKKPIFYTGEVGKIDFEDITDMVIAWRPLPEPYRPERSRENEK